MHKIAVTYEGGEIFPHFGHTEQFKVYDIAEGAVVSAAILPANGAGHGALAGLLRDSGVDTLICGGIGGGARAALEEAGIQLYGGAAGSADQAVEDLLAGRLAYDPAASCQHHQEEGHDCAHHSGHDCGGRHDHGGCGGHGHDCGHHGG